MAKFRIFYSWQSDRLGNLCRGLIRRAIDDAKAQIEDELEILDAARDEILIDQDTQGTAGSPSVADTILQKIRECDAFIADLTFVHFVENGRHFPNPNVLLEYGYALHALGEERIVGVFNENFGAPGDLPFDLRHRRWPILYQATDSGPEPTAQEQRRGERKKLSAALANALRPIIRAGQRVAGDLTGRAHLLGDVSVPFWERYPWNAPLLRSGPGTKLEFQEGAVICLSLWPRSAKLSFDIVELQRQAQGSLKPLAARRATGWSNARSRKGAAVFTFPSGESSKVLTASVVARDGSLHGIDCFHLKPNGVSHISEPFIPTTAIEEILVDGLQNFLAVAKEGICLRPPLDVVVSLEGVEGFFLAVDTKYFWSGLVGPVLGERIADVFTIDSYAVDPKELLLPFFRKVYDEAGEQRPDPDVA